MTYVQAQSSPSLRGLEALACPYQVPSPQAPPLSRWSDTTVAASPALIVRPATEPDVLAALAVARQNGLRVLVAGGHHGVFVRVDQGTCYLDMGRFADVTLDKDSSLVTVGGGVLTGDLIRKLDAEGYYTATVNSNAVGVVGSILGGGNTAINGLLGYMVDNVVSFRVITSSPSSSSDQVREVSASSTGDDLALFHALCGAGHGLGVVTSVTMKAYPTSDIRLQDRNKVWSRTLKFPASAAHDAASAFLALVPPPRPMSLLLAFARLPPGVPSAGEPVIVLTVIYWGPAPEDDAWTAAIFPPALVRLAFAPDESVLLPIPRMNDLAEPSNVHGGHRSMPVARVRALDPATIVAVFDRWRAFTDLNADARRSAVFINSFDPETLRQHGDAPDGRGKFVEGRDRGFSVVLSSWCQQAETKALLERYADDALEVCRRVDAEAGLPARTLPNGMRFGGVDNDELFSQDRFAELDRVKTVFDPENLFWSPYQKT